MDSVHKKILLAHATGVDMIHTCEIIRIEAISNYSKLYFSNGKTLVVAKVLKWVDFKLEPAGFIRIHRSHLINLSAIVSVTQNSVHLVSLEQIVISKRKKITCLQKLRSLAA